MEVRLWEGKELGREKGNVDFVMSREVEPGSSLHMVRINFDINVGSDALE
jgi:hypothetical protein